LKITSTYNNVPRPKKTLKKTIIKLYNTLDLPPLLYGSENWTVKARNVKSKKKVKQSRYTPWRRLGGEEV
jgi:hypothetical protein